MWHNTLFITLYLFRNLRLRIAMVCSAWRQLYISKHTSSTISCDLVLKIFSKRAVPVLHNADPTGPILIWFESKRNNRASGKCKLLQSHTREVRYASAGMARCLSMYVRQKSEFYWTGWTDRAGFAAWGLPSTYNTVPSRGFIYDSW